VPDSNWTLFGETLNPRLDVDGEVRLQLNNYRLGAPVTERIFNHLGAVIGTTESPFLVGQTFGQFVPEADFEANLQLTATQRINALFRPFEGGDREPTICNFSTSPTGCSYREEAAPAALFYEGQPFNWISPTDRYPMDITVAVGRIPFILQNGLFFENIFDGFAISKNNIQVGNLSNLNIIYFLTLDEEYGGQNFQDAQEQRKKLMGGSIDFDWLDYFFEAEYARGYDNHTVPGAGVDVNRNFMAGSITRNFGADAGVTLRAMGNTRNSTAGSGGLFAFESNKTVGPAQAYANIFGATQNWRSLSVEGSALTREGILFDFDRLANFPQLNPRGANSVGGAIGAIFWPKSQIRYTPEIGWLFDNRHNNSNDQIGAAFQIQANLASILIPGDTLAEIQKRGLLYGALLRLTFTGIQNMNRGVAGERFDYGERMEVIYRF
ncbi:MAG TPA: hypothetical protein VMT58_05790, partial [Candidatus Binataceae bacterium]|nr:hypothetical protein [Candidatus Binataceae bacterium]